MASSPPKKPLVSAEATDSDLALLKSLNHLSLSNSSPSPSPSPVRPLRSPRPQITTSLSGPLKPVPARSPSTPRPGSALRNGQFSASGTPSRSATPTLLKKASMNSLHSASGVRISSPSSLLSPSTARSPRPWEPSPEEKPLPIPESVATSHFKTELETYHNETPSHDLPAETVVILNDACYGHRYSRPRASRVTLNTIVERPERIKACIMGVSAAYVRLGERHEDGAFPVNPTTNPATMPSIPFRIHKTTRRLSLTSQTVTNVHGTKWMEELKQMCESAEAKLARNGKELQRVAQDGSNGEEPKQFHEADLYLCAESLDALEGSLGGVCDAVDAVFRPQGPRRAFVGIRPPGHHCSDSYPSGFCWVNNVHVGIMHGILSHGLTHAAIVDFDLHHGDGSQSIAWNHNARAVKSPKNAALWKKTSIGYFSLHDINSYPCENGDEEKIKNASICIENAHGQNVWNGHLQPWKTEAEFWVLYESKYSVLLEKMRSYLCAQTERLRTAGMNSRAAIFISAGFDASEWEGAGMQRHSVNVPTDFYARLTRDIVLIAAEEGTSVEGRIISVLEGGYSDRALCSGIMSHVCGLAGDGPATKEPELNGLGQEMGQKIAPARGRKDSSASERGARRYETSWWSSTQLELLEHVPETPPEPRKARNITPPTYSSPTHASVARSVNPARVRRTGSGLPPGAHGPPISTTRAPTPPPPDVPWTVATHALSKLLIPTERLTVSCTHEDLNAEATRRRQLALLPPGATLPTQAERPPTRTGLRERRAKLDFVEHDAEKARNDRRKTVAGTSVLATERELSRGATPVPGKQPPRQSGRRLSAASTIVSETLDLVEPAPLSAPLREPPRPETSFSVRPESSMSVRTTNGGNSNPLAVKKTRGPQKKDPVPRALKAPRAQKRQPTAGNAINTSPTKVFPSSARAHINKTPSPPANQKMDDMDSLVNDMKKVRITLLTPAERQTQDRQRTAREQGKNIAPIYVVTPTENKVMQLPDYKLVDPTPSSSEDTTAPVVNSPERPQKYAPLPEQRQAPPNASPASPELISGPTTPAPPPQTLLSKYPDLNPQRTPLPASSPIMATPTSRFRTNPARNGSPVRRATPPDRFVAYQPEGPTPKTFPMQKQQPLQWVPANVSSTPSTASTMRRADLPVFTATSSIPFASLGRPTNTNGGSVKGEGHGLVEPKSHTNGFTSVSVNIEGSAEKTRQ